jgi:hypothetical protein
MGNDMAEARRRGEQLSTRPSKSINSNKKLSKRHDTIIFYRFYGVLTIAPSPAYGAADKRCLLNTSYATPTEAT